MEKKRGKRPIREMTEEEKGALDDILDLMCSVTDLDEMRAMLDDLLTERELLDLVDRYLLMDDLYKGKSQREIASQRNMSLCKITRGSKMLKKENGFMRKSLSMKYDDHTHL